MEDRALIEYASRAAGMSEWLYGYRMLDDRSYEYGMVNDGALWNPLDNDGDALRLSAYLRLDLTFYNGFQEVHAEPANSDGLSASIEKYGDDVLAAARRAIVRAAAEIGRSMP